MAQQVKFYSTTASDFAKASKDAAGIYFVNGGEIYKGSERFGANKVWSNASVDSVKDKISGDMVIDNGAVYVFDGISWCRVVNPNRWTASSFGGAGQYIQSISQSADGTVTATAVTFPTLATGGTDGTIKLGTGSDVSVKGWNTVKTDISHLQSVVSYSGEGDSVVTATTGNFKNLDVSGTATFTATTISATTLSVATEADAKFGGATISAIADREALAKIAAIASATKSSSANGVGVTVVTQSGSIESVAVTADVTSGIADFTSDSTKIAKAGDVANYVDNKLLNINGAMRFYGTTTATTAATVADGNITKADSSFTALQAGDVVINTTYATEYIYDGKAWHELGDESHHSTKGFTGEGSVNLSTTAQTLAGGINELDKELGTITAEAMGTTASTVSGAIKELDGKVDTLTGEGEGSVKKALVDAKAYTDTEVKKVTDAFTGGEYTDGDAGVSVKVATAAKTAAPTVTVTVTKDTLNTTLGTTAVADKTIATSIGKTGVDTALATEKAVRDAIKDATLVWLNASGGVIA